MAFRPHKFGRYIIVDPIAVGGMAEIYRARLAAAKEGPDRVIVIKKVIANLSQNSEFLQMFEEEIKITVGLTHPNIIQIYDYGKVDDQYFMAMEYVEGKNLRQFVKRLADMKSMFSIDMSSHIISQVCHALAHAHSYKDRMTGKPLGIVHRDISPQNIMISYDGAVKLFDFGIAKAKSASEATRAGVIKGKPSYLSPEQINGEELDGRCDIFALGIVLWELLTAKRLFVAETDMGVLRLIQSAKIEPPSTFNPAVPQALDAIVLKSLTRDKNKRYQGAEEFQRDLHKFLYSFNPSFNPADLSYYAQELFKQEIRDDRDRLAKYLAIPPVDDGKDAGTEGAAHSTKKSLSTKLADGLISTTDFNREMMDMAAQKEKTGKIEKSDLQLASSTAMPQPKMAKVGTGSTGGASPPLPTKKITPPPLKTGVIMATGVSKRPPSENMVIPPWTKQGVGSNGLPKVGTKTASMLRKELDQHGPSGSRNIAVLMAVLIIGGVFAARQYGLLAGTPLEFLHPGDSEMAAPVAQKPALDPNRIPSSQGGGNSPAASSTEGMVLLQTAISDYRVLVNGQAVAVRNNQFNAPLNQNLNIDVIKLGYQTARFQTKLTSAAPAAFRVDLVPLPSGSLYLTTTPEANVELFFDGVKVLEGRTPLKREQVTMGKYRARIENSLLNVKYEFEFVIEEGKLTRIEKNLGNR
jgi:serine/threonine protein kinase